MGVQGLWKLLESAGHTVPVEAMSHRILAVDVSIWLNQIIKAMRDNEGNRLANAHIIAVYHRVCKLLFHHVKPVVVFDGAVPAIKRRTCAKRKAQKNRASEDAESQKREKVKLSLQKLAVAHVMGKEAELPQPVENRRAEQSGKSDMFYLDPQKTDHLFDKLLTSETDELQNVPLSKSVHLKYQSAKSDPFSKEFQSLPPQIQHELLLEHIEYTKERAKVVSYAQSTSSDSFSQGQIENVVATNSLNKRLVELRKMLKETGNPQTQSGHTVQVFKSGVDSEIVFTKQINNTDYDILDTRKQSAVKKEDVSSQIVGKEEPVKEKTEELPKVEEMKNLFFGSDSEKETVEDSDSESGDDREVKNVLGLSRGHPGTFRNPYSNKMKKTSIDTGLQLKVNAAEYCDVSSSSESEFEEVIEVDKSPVVSGLDSKQITPDIVESIEDNSVSDSAADKIEIAKEVIRVPSETPSVDVSEENHSVSSEQLPPQMMGNVDGTAKEIGSNSLQHVTERNSTGQISPKQTIEFIQNGNDDVSKQNIPPASTQDKLEGIVDDRRAPLDVADKPETVSDTLNISSTSSNDFPKTVDLETLQDDITEELAAVKAKHRKAMSVADTVNKGIISEVKELLTIFGIPYLDAPGEAEAQCAELCNLGVCEGVITDDSDIFLFGKVRVYKDVFKKDRDMKCYTSEGVEESLGLNRRSLIDLAQLTGSDYCTGVRGVGCVLALEIISKYKTLAEFVELPDVEVKYRKFDMSGLPNLAAVDAYLHPKVNSSNEKFTWNDIDVCLVKDFMFKKLGWTSSKVDDTLKPVLESLNSKTKQKSITNFFNISQPKPPGSKRVQNAIGEMRGTSTKVTAKATAKVKTSRKRKPAPKKAGKSKSKKTKYVCSEDSDSD